MKLSMKTRYWLDMSCWLILTAVLYLFAPVWAAVTAGVIGTIVMLGATITYRKMIEYIKNDSPTSAGSISLEMLMEHVHRMASEMALLSAIRKTGSIDKNILITELLTRADCVDDPDSIRDCTEMVEEILPYLLEEGMVSETGVIDIDLTHSLDEYDQAAERVRARAAAEKDAPREHGLDFDIDLGIGNFKA